MRNRCEEFYFNHVFDRAEIRETEPCSHHLAEWIIDGAGDNDVACLLPQGAVIRLPLAAPAADANEDEPVKGFKKLMQVARISDELQTILATQLEDLGVVDVTELSQHDWETLAAWARLKVLQQRRLLQHVVGPQRN